MRVLLALVASVVLASFARPAQAADEKFGAGPLYGGGASPGGTVTCRLYNPTPNVAHIFLKQITDNSGLTTQFFDFDSCDRLAPLNSCSFGLSIPGKLAYGCRVFVRSETPTISGILEIQHPNREILASTPFLRQK